MLKYVVVSTNNNPDYYIYAPYLEKAWKQLGWNLCIMVTQDVDIKHIGTRYDTTVFVRLPGITGLRDATIAQVGRLYAAQYLPIDSIVMTSDMDLLPLTDYWHPHAEKITVFGHDLTDYSYYPMGYVAMTAKQWREKMNLSYDTKSDILSDAKELQIAFSEDWNEWWNYDWTLLTKRLKPFVNETVFVKRGRRLTGTYAYGRVDRGDGCKIPVGETLIDAHLENHNSQHPEKFNKFLALFESIYGKL